eukprot:98417-Prorocentrum_minimum.AAC.1
MSEFSSPETGGFTVPPFPTPEAIAIIEEELGSNLSDLFTDFTCMPSASASIGQVYKAREKVTGRV